MSYPTVEEARRLNQAKPNPHKRYPVVEPRIRVRFRADGSPKFYVQHGDSYIYAGEKVEEAKAKKSELGVAKAQGVKPVVQSRTTFGELAESWYEAKAPGLGPHTSAYYRKALDLVLLPRFGKWKIGAVDVDAIAKLTRDLERDGLHAIDRKVPKRPLGQSSITNYLAPARMIMRRAAKRRLIAVSPFDLLEKEDRPKQDEGKSQPHAWTDAELAALLAASAANAAKPESRYDYTPLLRLTAMLGLRCGEVLGLRWQDFDREEGRLHVRGQWGRHGDYSTPKTASGVRDIALPPGLRDELIALRLASRFSQDSDPIFASRNGKPLGHRNVTRRGWEAARDAAGLPKSISFHDLRHAAASRLIASGLDVVTVAGILGHKDPNVTLRVYAHLFNRKQRDEKVREALTWG